MWRQRTTLISKAPPSPPSTPSLTQFNHIHFPIHSSATAINSPTHLHTHPPPHTSTHSPTHHPLPNTPPILPHTFTHSPMHLHPIPIHLHPLPTHLQQFLHREDGLADRLYEGVCSLTTTGQHVCRVQQQQEKATVIWGVLKQL